MGSPRTLTVALVSLLVACGPVQLLDLDNRTEAHLSSKGDSSRMPRGSLW